uniref:BRCT domain-containing protein n=1 Tax=Macrostomum lignano TaxID=282301 RepID=A0A1I8IDV1_9PLAT
MARARRLRRSLPAKLRRQLENLGDSDEEQEATDPDEGKEADSAMMPPPVCIPSSSVETNADVIESPVSEDRGVQQQDSEQVSLVLATPQRRELDAEVRKIEEEIKNVRQLLEQPESESPQMSTPPPPRLRRRLLITSSGLDPTEVARLRRLCEAHSGCCVYQARFQFDPELHTTHVIIRESSSMSRVSERTLKYFQALVSGAWLLSFDWVSESLAAGSLLPESDFEIQGDLSCGVNHLGPARSRGGRDRCPGPSRLLEQFCIAPVGDFVNMPSFALQTLVQQCGGQFAASPESLPRRQATGCLSVAVADQDDAKFSEARCQAIAASGDIVVLNRDWLLDSISKFRVQQLDSPEYCIAPDCYDVTEILTRQRIRLSLFDDF